MDRRRSGKFASSPESEVVYKNEVVEERSSFEERKSFVLGTIVSISANNFKGTRNCALRSTTLQITTN